MTNPRKVPPSSLITPHPPAPEAELEAAPAAPPAPRATPAPRVRLSLPWLIGLLVALVAAAVATPFLLPVVRKWLEHAPVHDAAEKDDKGDKAPPCELVRDAKGKPVYPPALHLSAEAARTLRVTPETMWTVAAADAPRPLPPLEGSLAYTNANLFPVRPRFPGEVASITEITRRPFEEAADDLPPSAQPKAPPQRPLDFGDRVKKGDTLAIVWSKDLGTAKAALVDAMSNLRWSKDTLKRETKTYEEGALSLATVRAAERQVRLDTNAQLTAERTLRMWKLTDKEIDAIKKEAATIEDAKRDPKKETAWARVEVKAPHDGVIVEKNTNVGDWVDPVNGNPMFRIADLSTLAAWVTPMEEYLPILRKLMGKEGSGRLTWQLRLSAEPHAAPMEGPVTRIAPSLDPINHSLLVMGPVANPDRRLLVGQFITATIYVRPEKGLVEIPTTALNEDGGQSLVFVELDAARRAYAVRRVAVKDRFKDVVFVRSDVPAALPQKQGLRGPWPIQPLRAGERVVTQGVPMLTAALRDLLTREEAR